MHLLSGIVPLLMSAVFIFLSHQLALVQSNKPGPGLWPLILSVIIAAASILLLITDHKPDSHEKFSTKSKIVLYSVFSIIIFIYAFSKIGVVISSVLLLVFWLRIIGKESWRLTVLVSLSVTAFVYLLFVVWLRIPFPVPFYLGR